MLSHGVVSSMSSYVAPVSNCVAVPKPTKKYVVRVPKPSMRAAMITIGADMSAEVGANGCADMGANMDTNGGADMGANMGKTGGVIGAKRTTIVRTCTTTGNCNTYDENV